LNKKNQPFYVAEAQISEKNHNLKLHIVPENLLINGAAWHIPEDNRLLIQSDKITARDFVFSHKKQRVSIASGLENIDENNIEISFNNFNLSNIMALFNQENYIAEGNLRGNIVAVDPLGKLGFTADFGINSLKVLQAPL